MKDVKKKHVHKTQHDSILIWPYFLFFGLETTLQGLDFELQLSLAFMQSRVLSPNVL